MLRVNQLHSDTVYKHTHEHSMRQGLLGSGVQCSAVDAWRRGFWGWIAQARSQADDDDVVAAAARKHGGGEGARERAKKPHWRGAYVKGCNVEGVQCALCPPGGG